MRTAHVFLSALLTFGFMTAVGTAAHAEAVGVTRVCSSRLAAKAFADSLALKMKDSFAADVTAKRITKPNVRVIFSGPKTRPSKTTIDFAKDVQFSVNLTAATGKVTVQGNPASTTLYASCDAGVTLFTVLINYKLIASDGKLTPMTVRETFERTIPGQYL